MKSITVIDLGSSKIAAATANVDRSGKVSLAAAESLHSRGISEGEITDINKAIEDIALIMERVERKGRKKIKRVSVMTRGSDVEMYVSRGMVPLSKSPREIAKKDIKRCLELAAMVKLPLDREVLGKIVKAFHVDGRDAGIRNPLGLYGIRLEAESFIATASRSKIQSITKCIDHAGFLLSGIHLSCMAQAASVLDREEREKGVLLLDIGDTLKEALVFKNGMLQNYSAVKRGALLTPISTEGADFSSVVVTGGGALVDGIIEATEKTFGIPARIGIVKNAQENRLNSQDALIHTSTIGLINQIANEYKEAHALYQNPLHRTLHKLHDIYESYF